MHLINLYRTTNQNAAEYTFFLSACEIFSRTHYVLGHQKKSLNKLKKTEIISSIFSDHEGIKLEINYQKNSWKYHRHLKLNSMVLNNCWFSEEIKEENKQI